MASIVPHSFEDVQRLAIMAVKAGLYPKEKRSDNEDEETAIARAAMAIMQGLECGIPPMQAVQNIAIINGRAMMYGDLLTALLWSRGFKIKKWIEGDGEEMVGHARIVRPDGEIIEKSYSVKQAKKARLWDVREKVRRKGKNNDWYDAENDAPWFRFAERMLEWRAFGYAVKDGASDATHGMLVREEADPTYNRVVDVTPTATPVTAQISPPDIPDEIPDTPVDQTPAAPDVPDETITDEAGLLDKLQSDYSACDSEDDVATLAKDMDTLIKRMSKAGQKKAKKILEGEE